MHLNQIVWTCKQSISSSLYGEVFAYKPYQVKITGIYNNWVNPSTSHKEVPVNEPNHHISIVASCFNKETGEVDNSNDATVNGSPIDFFLTKEKAIEHYNELLLPKNK